MLTNLREAFRERTRAGACQIACTDAEFFIHDPAPPAGKGTQARPCGVHPVAQHPVYDLQVLNPDRRLIHVIQTDGCLYLSGDNDRCDCVLLLPDVLACFVEFKKPESDHEKHADGEDRFTRANRCFDQLAATIKDFVTRGVINSQTRILAYACVGRTRQRPAGAYQGMNEEFRRRFVELRLNVRLVVLNEIRLPAHAPG